MNKDIIYIDTEDDITSIIDKVKQAEKTIVALVPPKRVGVLQSAVNLKLLTRAAKQANKKTVLITNNQALTNLAAGALIPVAKNLQSKPELPEITALNVDDEDVINGEELPVGEHAAASGVAEKTANSSSLSSAVDDIDKSEQTAAATAAANAPAKSKKSKIPNFDSFRKKLFLFGGLAILLIAFLVWAIFFAGSADIKITAKTSPVNIDKVLNLSTDAKLQPEQNILPLTTKTTKRTQSTTFEATGEKNVGDKATAPVTFTNNSQEARTIDAGTKLTDQNTGLVFTVDSTVTIPGGTVVCSPFPNCHGDSGEASGAVTATEGGDKYNGASGSLEGTPDRISASFSDAASGGTNEIVNVVTQADVDKAKQAVEKQAATGIEEELAKQFDGGFIIIDESFTATTGDPAVTPDVGEKADTAQLAVETTYSLRAVKRDDLVKVFEAYLKAQMSDPDSQEIYASGDDSVMFTNWQSQDDKFTVEVRATGQIGPVIDQEKLKQDIQGKVLGEVQEQVLNINGVEDVTIDLSPFWVNQIPAPENVTIEFVIKDDK